MIPRSIRLGGLFPLSQPALLRVTLVITAIIPFCLSPAARGYPPISSNRLFGGKVIQVDTRAHWFLMEGGASKQHSQVKIVLNNNTHWSGLTVKNNMPPVGIAVLVTAVPNRDGSFRAINVRVNNPHQRPVLGGGPRKAG